jgi:hypothetical protein
MFLIQQDSDGTSHAVATGRIVSRFKTYQNDKNLTVTELTLCVKANVAEKKYQQIKVCAYGETASRVIRYAKLHKDILVVFGNCAVDKTMTELRGEKSYSMYASAVISPQMILDMFEYHKNSMQIDKILSEKYEQNIRYDYEDEINIDDHKI